MSLNTLKGWAIDLTGSTIVEGVLVKGFKFELGPITLVVLGLAVV